MTGKEVLKAMGQIDEELVEEASTVHAKKKTKKKTKKKSLGWVAFITLAFICILGGTTIASSDLGKIIFSIFSKEDESGYQVEVEMKNFSMDDFKGDVIEVEDLIRKQIAEYEPYMSWFPTHWQGKYESSQQVVEYLGLEALKNPEWYMEEKEVTLDIYGNRSGKFEQIRMEIWYVEDGVSIQSYADILTKYADGDKIEMNHIMDSNIEHKCSSYMNLNGKECTIVTSAKNANAYWGKDGYVVVDGILYSIHISYRTGQEEQVTEIMKKWLDRY